MEYYPVVFVSICHECSTPFWTRIDSWRYPVRICYILEASPLRKSLFILRNSRTNSRSTFIQRFRSNENFFHREPLSRFRLRSTRTWKPLLPLPVDPEEDSFCKGTPRGIILQLVNSCPHPVSRTLCASSSSFSFLFLSRHDPDTRSLLFFSLFSCLFPPARLTRETDSARARKREREGEIARERNKKWKERGVIYGRRTLFCRP